MSGFQRVGGIGSVQSYEDDDGYDPESNRGGPYTKRRKGGACRKWCCAIFVLVLLGGVAAGGYVAYDKYLKPMWAESNESANGEADSGSGNNINNETKSVSNTESSKPDVPPPSPLLPPEPIEDLAVVCAADFAANNETSICLEQCAQGTCCFPSYTSEKSCSDIPGAAAICDMYQPCVDVLAGNEASGLGNMTDMATSTEGENPKEEYPVIIGNATASNEGETEIPKDVPLGEPPSQCGGIDEYGDEVCYDGTLFCTTDDECEAELGPEYGKCLETCSGENSNSVASEEGGPGGMLGYDGQAVETPSFCAAANGTCIGLVDCKGDDFQCDTVAGEYCAPECGPEPGSTETNDGEAYYEEESNFPPQIGGGGAGMAAALYSICMPAKDVSDPSAIEKICEGLSPDMMINMCDPAVASEPGECFCDFSVEESGCSEGQACTEPFCSLVSDMPTFPNYCYIPPENDLDQFVCGTDACQSDLDCPDGQLCSTDDVCQNESICCSPV